MAARFAESGWSQGLINLKTRKWNGVVRLALHKLSEPLRWRQPSTVFVNSMTDMFHEGFTNEEIAAVFGVMAACPQHTFQILTKRAQRMREWFEWLARETAEYLATPSNELAEPSWVPTFLCATYARGELDSKHAISTAGITWPLQNVWLGVSVENQEAHDERAEELLACPAAVYFFSVEPMLGPVDASRSLRRMLRTLDGRLLRNDHPDARSVSGTWRRPVDWVIAGCESGPGARECKVEWLRSLRDQCAAAGAPYFLKQARGHQDDDSTLTKLRRVDAGPGSKHKAGGVIELPYLDGVQHAEFPQ